MTVWDLLRAGSRFWLATLTGALLTVLAGVLIVSAPGVYWAQIEVIFVTPGSDSAPNTFSVTQTSAIVMAGIIQREIAGGPGATSVSDDVTIVGQGIRDGAWVRLVNSGGQWANNFDRPALDVQAVAATPGEVSRRIDAIVRRIDAALLRRQEEVGVPPGQRFTTTTSPRSVVVRQGEGHRELALVVTVLLGFGMTMTAVSLLEVRRRHLVLVRPREWRTTRPSGRLS